MYLPSQDKVVEGLAGDMLERGEINIMARGHQQNFELNQPVGSHDASDEVDVSVTKGNAAESNKKWFEELAKADERGNRFRMQLEESQKRKLEVEDKLQQTEKHVIVREEEIKRMQRLYEGGQNLEVLSVRHTHETNEKTIGKLANQVDFLNRENHSLTQQILILKGDKQAIKTLDAYKSDIDNLAFENQTLRKDL